MKSPQKYIYLIWNQNAKEIAPAENNAVTCQVHLVQNRYAKSFLQFIFLKFDILLFGMKYINRLNVEKKSDLTIFVHIASELQFEYALSGVKN